MTAEYRFRIAGHYKPQTLPMARLADYLGQLATLFGEPSGVTFVGVEAGSAVLVAAVDDNAAPTVQARLDEAVRGQGPKDARSALSKLDAMLAEDQASGELRRGEAVVLTFPGGEPAESESVLAVRQAGTLDGQVIRIGGTDDNAIAVHLRDGDTVHTGLTCAPELADQLKLQFRTGIIRVTGEGAWERQAGTWRLRTFRIADFEVLVDQPLDDLVADVRRSYSGSWADVADPLATILAERHGGGTAH